MPLATLIRGNLYKDSVALMRIAESLLACSGVSRATLLMGTPANKAMLAEAKLFSVDLDAARPADVMIVVEARSAAELDDAVVVVQKLLDGQEAGVAASAGVNGAIASRTIAMGLAESPAANLVQISVPGPYAGAEALKALKRGRHVFLFSDNVPLDQEREIKRFAQSRNLIVMGPDCGTAILNGVPLGFSNVVRRGGIGLAGASGTGLQQVSCLVHSMGGGISHAIGTGGRDGAEDIGGISLLQALDWLAADGDTQVIVIVSKPPAQSVNARVMKRAASLGKPVIVLFLGSDARAASPNVETVATLYDAAARAVRATGVQVSAPEEPQFSAHARPGKQRFIRGLYSGGTFATEAQLVWKSAGILTRSNVPLVPGLALADARVSEKHTAVDMGGDEFTVGRPHPMIDYSERVERLIAEARDPAVAVIVLDVVLGYGSHANPAGMLAPAIEQARSIAADEGRELDIVAFVCGTDGDPQGLMRQQQALLAAGAQAAACSTHAARLAAALAGAAVPPALRSGAHVAPG